ncbi:MAG TPA: nickel-dependent lactate racemase [Acidobacteria bacterium]|nr:nickel-dependent lactate racemase [Acidobacteriota bacterium]
MLVNLAYGRTGLPVEFPDDRTTVIEPTYVEGLADQVGAVREALDRPTGTAPLRALVSADQTVAISICDVTRPMPNATVLPAVLEALSHVPTSQIAIMIASGTHRATTRDELLEMLGEEIVDRNRIVVHDAFDNTELVSLGSVEGGIPVWLNRTWSKADVRITTGFVEPHFFAGFSGGPKMVAPGLAGFKTIMRLHDAEMIRSPDARWGVTEGNPIHDGVRRIAALSGVDFSIDVAINRNRQITHVAAGELFTVHRKVREVVRRTAMQSFSAPFDVVVTTNSGYPLDQNLYQTVKGMSAAAQVVKPNGVIVCASECSDGYPDHGEYLDILTRHDSADKLLTMINSPGHNRHDQWEVQVQAQIQQRAEVLLRTDGLSDAQVRSAHLTPIEDVGAATREALDRFGSDARVCVLPEGPQTIPYLAETA